MKISLLRTISALFFLHVAFPVVSLHAQSQLVVSGVITDPSGAAISGAMVSAMPISPVPPASSVPAFQTKSGTDGRYKLTLPAGAYRIRVISAAFDPARRDLLLTAGQAVEWNPRLALAVLSSSVVVTASAEPTQTEYTTSPVDIVTQQDIDQRQEIWLGDMLATTPGAAFTRLGALGGITSFFLDGGDSDFTKILIDGTPVNQPGGAFDFSNLTTDEVGKVEIVHGASSALFGSDALTGVIQIFSPRGNTRIPELEVTADGGNLSTGDGSARLSGLLGAFDYSNAASYFQSNGQGPNDSFRDTTLAGNYGWRFSDVDSVRLSVRSISSFAGQPGQTLLEPPYLGQSADQRDFFGNLSWDFSLGDHWQQHFAGTEAYIRQTFAEPPGPNVFDQYNVAGFEEQTSYLYRQSAISLGYQYEVENGVPNGPHVRRNNQGGYIDLRNQFGPRLTVTAGVRAEDNSSFGTRVVPRVGASYALRQGSDFWGATRLLTSYGLGIKEPNFTQSFEADPCFPGNPDLQPERSTTFNAGVDQALVSDHVHVSVNYFHNDFHDIVSFAGGPPTTSCPYGTGTFFNTDSARAYGVNSAIETRITHWLSVRGQYSYDDSRVLKAPNATDPTLTPGNRLFLRPLNSAVLIVNAAFRRMNWNLSGYYVGRETDSDFLGLGYTYNPGYVLWNMAASIPIRRNLSAIGRVENIFDRHYSYAVGYPGLGTNFRAGVKYTWGGIHPPGEF
jgi:outer membrane cobalamin receptor